MIPKLLLALVITAIASFGWGFIEGRNQILAKWAASDAQIAIKHANQIQLVKEASYQLGKEATEREARINIETAPRIQTIYKLIPNKDACRLDPKTLAMLNEGRE